MAKILIGRKLSSVTDSVTVVGTVDVSDRAARILGHVVVDSSALPAGAATEATLLLANGHLASIDTDIDVALSTRASEATLVALGGFLTGILDVPTSTRASEATLLAVAGFLSSIDTDFDVALSTRASEVTLSAINAKLNSLGQKTMAGSVPVVLASDQSVISVTATIPGTVDVSDRAARILGHVVVDSSALPTGAATEVTLAEIGADIDTIEANFDVALSTRASQVTVASILAQLDVALSTRLAEATFTSRINTLGQKTMAASTPVVIASDQSAVSISGTVTANQGTPAVVGNAWFMKISDGVDTVGISTVGGSKALKVDVIQSVGSAGSTFGAAFPATGTAAGFSDGTDMQSARVFDVDTGAGVQDVLGANIRISASGGSIEAKGQKTMANSLPVVIASDQAAIPVTVSGTTPVGTQGNAWAAAAVLANGTSASIDCQFVPFITAFGSVSANTTITLQVSQDNATFYDALSTKITSAPADFVIFATSGARYTRLKSSAAATITASITGKD